MALPRISQKHMHHSNPLQLGEDLLECCHIFGDVDAVSDLLKLLGSLQGQVLQGREDVGRWVGAHKFL